MSQIIFYTYDALKCERIWIDKTQSFLRSNKIICLNNNVFHNNVSNLKLDSKRINISLLEGDLKNVTSFRDYYYENHNYV